MNARHQFTEQADVQAAIAILSDHAQRQLVAEVQQARSERAATIIRDCITLLRNSHRRSFEYRDKALEYEPGSEEFKRYQKWSDEQRHNMRRAIREIRRERNAL